MRWAILLLTAGMALAADSPHFEVATLKISPPPQGDQIFTNLGQIEGNRLILTNARLSDCLKFAYGLVADAQLAGPDWIQSRGVRFDVVGQMPPATSRRNALVMLQNLLADRLDVLVHHEQRELSYVALVAAKGGAKIKRVPDDVAQKNTLQLGGRIESAGMPMQTLALLLSRFQRETVLDQTGLEGKYEIRLEWSPTQDADAGPSLATAVQEQLGLKLESRRGPVDVLVVDHAEKTPADN